jgi:hypothetical protein
MVVSCGHGAVSTGNVPPGKAVFSAAEDRRNWLPLFAGNDL